MTIRVLIVDDQKFIRLALRSLLAELPLIEVVGEASDGEMAIRQVEALRPDVVLMDINMDVMGGVESTKRIHDQFEAIKILILSGDYNDASVIHALQNGAAGYILRDNISTEELSLAIQVVHLNNIYLSPKIGQIVIAKLIDREQQIPFSWETLTPRERDVAALVAKGSTNSEIAEVLHISETTARNHISNILSRLNLKNRIQLAFLVNGNSVV